MTALDEYIARGERFLSGEGDDDAKDLVRLLCAAIASQDPTYKHGLSLYRGTVNGYPRYTDDDARKDVERIVAKMKVLRDEKEHDLEVARLNAAAAGVSVAVDNSNSNVATATASATVTISQAIDAVDADPGLREEQKAELQSLLTQAKGAVAKGDKGFFARIGSKIMEGVEQAAPALIAKVLEFLASQATGL